MDQFNEFYELESIFSRISVLRSNLDLPDQANVNALVDILALYMGLESVFRIFLINNNVTVSPDLFDVLNMHVSDIVYDYLKNIGGALNA